MRALCITAALLYWVFSFWSTGRAADEPFIYPASWGGTGLMEIPTARIMKFESWRFGASQVDPIRTYYGAFSPLKGLEIDGRVTEYLHTGDLAQGNFQDYGNQKDKAIDVKLQFLPESKYLPALAIGINDPHGTRLQGAQYLVASKQIYPFDFTIGLGNGRYGKNPLPASREDIHVELVSDPKGWWEDAQFFYGIQFAPTEKFAVMAEYSPVKLEQIYRYDPDTQDKIKSKYNVGLRWKPLEWAELDLSWQRGNKLGANCALSFDIGRPLVPIVDLPYREQSDRYAEPFIVRLTDILAHEGFSDIVIDREDDALWIEARNSRYYYTPKAVAVIIRSAESIAPADVRQVHITVKENGIPLTRFTTARSDISEWLAEKLTTDEYRTLALYETDVWRLRQTRGAHPKPFDYYLEPSIETFLNDPSGFFKYRLGGKAGVTYRPWRGAEVVAGLEGYPLNTVSTVNEPLSIPVRSDIALYEEQGVNVGRLMLDQIVKGAHEVYGRLAFGWLEIEYAGVDGEVAMSVWDGRLMVGVSGSVVKKRDPGSVLGFKHYDVKDVYTTAFLNTRLDIPELDMTFDLKSGRFLAGDMGTRVTVSKFIHGVVVSAWYGITDTSCFDDEYNRGYHDKGIAVTIPLRLFQGRDSRTSYRYALSPWTRDVAQDIYHYRTVFDFIGRNTRIDLARDAQEMQP